MTYQFTTEVECVTPACDGNCKAERERRERMAELVPELVALLETLLVETLENGEQADATWVTRIREALYKVKGTYQDHCPHQEESCIFCSESDDNEP